MIEKANRRELSQCPDLMLSSSSIERRRGLGGSGHVGSPRKSVSVDANLHSYGARAYNSAANSAGSFFFLNHLN